MPKIALTTRFIAQAKCPEGKRKIEYVDEGLEGFFVEILSSGTKTFYQRYIDPRGRQRSVKIARANVLSLDEARKKAIAIKADVALGNDPRKAQLELREVPTIRAFVADRFLPFLMESKRSWKNDERLIRNHILPALGGVYLDELTPEAIGRMLSRMRAQGLANGTCNRPLIILRYMYNMAQLWEVPRIDRNPAKRVPLLEEVKRERYLSDEETQRLIEAIRAEPNRLVAAGIELLLLTGARRNEIFQARWEHYDPQNKTLLVPLSKSGQPRLIALNDPAIALIEGLPSRGRDWLFASEATGRPPEGVHHVWDRIRRRAGLDDVRLHDLRHSYASYLVNNGVSLYIVQQLLGHTQPRTTQRYAHLHRETLNHAANVAAETVKRAVG